MSAPIANSTNQFTTPSGAVYFLHDFPHLNSIVDRQISVKYRQYLQEHETNSIPTVEIDISNTNATSDDAEITVEIAQKLVFLAFIGHYAVLRKFAGLEAIDYYRLNGSYDRMPPEDIFLSRLNLENVPDRINPDDMQETIVHWSVDAWRLTYRQVEDFMPFFKHSIHGLHASRIVSLIINIGNRSPTEDSMKGAIYTTLARLAKWATATPRVCAVVVTIKVSTACETAVRSLLQPISGDLIFLGGSIILKEMREKIRKWRFSTQDTETLRPDERQWFIPASDRLYLKMMVG